MSVGSCAKFDSFVSDNMDDGIVNLTSSSQHHISPHNVGFLDLNAESLSESANKAISIDNPADNMINHCDDNQLFSSPLSDLGNGLTCSSLVKEAGFYPPFPVDDDKFLSPLTGMYYS